MEPTSFLEKCEDILQTEWNTLFAESQRGMLQDILQDKSDIEAIRRSVNCTTKTYRYVLPTQLLAKLADPGLDCTCLQVV